MNHDGYLFGEFLLKDTASRVFAMFGNECVNSFFVETCENFDITFGILVADVQPELIKFIWCRVVAVEPDVSAFCFTEFTSVCLCDERTGKGVYFTAVCAADKLCTRCYVPPLV